MSRYAIYSKGENDGQHGCLVLAAFGPFEVVDKSRYNNEQDKKWHYEQALAYWKLLDNSEKAHLVSAAPELLGVARSASIDCLNVAEHLRKIGGTECVELAAILDSVVERNNAAIAKADGEEAQK